MASAQNRKRAYSDELSQEHGPKKIKSKGRLHRPSNFPPEFWDKLSKVPLTRRALRELDQRNSARPVPAAPALYTTDLAYFARHGGPDLRHLRGYPKPKGADLDMASPSSGPPSQQTKPTPTATKKSSAYDRAFEKHLDDNKVYLHGRKSKPKNNPDLHQPRPSLSPSKFSDSAFERFRDEHDDLGSEGDTMRKIIPVITGSTNIHNSGEALFSNLQSMTGGATVDAKPDFYDGARLSDIDKKVSQELDDFIIPTTNIRRPVAPNFFLEAKGPDGAPAVAKRQAGYDGALGARAMCALQNYGMEPVFDGNAYTYSSTYSADTGTLQLYTHHVTAPTSPEGRPEYHMNLVDGWQMTGNITTFRQGATAFRNARDLAQRHRDGFIRTANARARQSGMEAPPEAQVTADMTEFEESTDEFVDCEDYPPQAIGTDDYAAPSNVDRQPALPPYLCAEDKELSQESTSSCATGVTSSFRQSQAGSKRTRPFRSPPQSSKKQGSAKTPRRAIASSARGSTSLESVMLQPAVAEEYWTWSEERLNWYYLNEDGRCIWHDGE